MTEMKTDTKFGGWVGKILWINLTEKTSRTINTLDYGPQYIGGRGIAARIGWEFIPPGVGALDPENLLIVMTGTLTGTTAPFSGRTSISSLSPQAWPEEWFSRSNFGGHWGPSLKYAGYDGLVVEGRSDEPVTLWIEDGKLEFRSAQNVWGKGAIETQKVLLDEFGKDTRVLTIGQAGENLSRISIIMTETESAAGQGGFGAVMGSKNLKAIAVRGTGAVRIAQPELFKKRTKAIIKEVRGGNRFANSDLDQERVKKYKQRWQACTQQCAMKCGGGCRYYEVLGPVSGEEQRGQFHCVSNFIPGVPGTFYDWKMSFEGAFEVRHILDDYGINHWDILLGLIPWLNECHKAGLISEINGRAFDLNDPVFWIELLKDITFRRGETGDALAEGGLRAQMRLGFGKEQADPLYAAWGSAGHWDGHGDRGNRIVYPFWLPSALQWAVDVRDPYSSSHGYTALTMHWSPFLDEKTNISWEKIKKIGEKIYGDERAVDPRSDYEGKELPAIWHAHRSVMKDSVSLDDNIFPVILSMQQEDGFARADDMQGIDFEYHLYTAATGQEISREEFEMACERIYNIERAIQIRNYNRQREVDEMVIPYFEFQEWFQNPYLDEKKSLEKEKFYPLLEKFYSLCGWDAEKGWPTPAKLRELGLQDVEEALYK